MQKKEYTLEIGGKKLTAIFSDFAEKAHGSVMLKYGNTVVLATAVMSKESSEYRGFFNLTVDFIERFYAAGAILGSRFTRREGKPSVEAVLSSRVIDRTLRPLFPSDLKHAVQVTVTVLSEDGDDSEMLAINAASLALGVSEIPWGGPVGAVRIAKKPFDSAQGKDGKLVVNPKQKKREEFPGPKISAEEISFAKLDALKPSPVVLKEEELDPIEMIICGKEGKVNMVEGSADQVSESEMKGVFSLALQEIERLENFQRKIIDEIGKEKHVHEKDVLSEESLKLFEREIKPKLKDAVFAGPGKKDLDLLHTKWNELVTDAFPEREDFWAEDDLFDSHVNKILHSEGIENDRRPDGRKMDEVRDLFVEAGGVSEILHGSGTFYRGGTHTLSVLTLGGPDDGYLVDTMRVKKEDRFMHHYNFLPFSVGELGKATFTNRREIGHGALAERALRRVLPSQASFPYTIRVVSEIISSNGSSSMAAVTAGSIALADGGVPIKASVAGVAMGLLLEQKNERTKELKNLRTEELKYKILTDIQGPEDHFGDMDFKIAGTRKGITAIQLDIKLDGIPVPILMETLEQAKKTRLQILDEVEKVIPAPRKTLSPHAPRILSIKIKTDQIGLLIGPGGKTINAIQDQTGAKISIEEDGTIYITGRNGSAEEALRVIEEMTREYKVGDTAKGEVVKIADFGAFVRIRPGTEGLVHISEFAPFHVEKVTDVLKEKDIVPIKVINIDEQGRLSLSIKAADPGFFKKQRPLVEVG